MKHQRITSNKQTAKPLVVNEKSHAAPTDVEPAFDPAFANMPVRCVNFIEVGGMEAARVSILLQELNRQFASARGGIHYLIPVRDGKIRSDVIFEAEILEMVNKLCEVKDGTIVLRDGAEDVHVIRRMI